MAEGKLQVVFDPVADALDDMAGLALHWARNRERGRMPGAIRMAMLMVAREMLAQADAPPAAEPAKAADIGNAGGAKDLTRW